MLDPYVPALTPVLLIATSFAFTVIPVPAPTAKVIVSEVP